MKEIPLFKVFMSDKCGQEVNKVLYSGFIGQGHKVEEFEQKLRNWFGTDWILTTNSATSAEHLALRLLSAIKSESYPGLQWGDEVLATPLTCTASNWPIVLNGCKIKWVDVSPDNLNMDLDDLARKITPRTKGIMGVHWGGYPMDLDRIKEIQENAKNLYGFKPALIEDCAHSLGAKYKGKKIGLHGNICTFSFQAIKHITSVDGGIIIVPHEKLYRIGKLLRWYGIDRESNRKDFRCESDIEIIGDKLHMNDVNATIGMCNFEHVDWILQKYADNARYYREQLKDVSGIRLLESNPDMESANWLFTMKVDKRDDFARKMSEYGIMTSRVHERNDKHTCVQEFKAILPNLEQVVREMTCIPVGWWVSKEDREWIVDCIKKGW